MMVNIVLVSYIDAYFDPNHNIEEIQVTEIMNTGVLQSDWNFDAWDFGVVYCRKRYAYWDDEYLFSDVVRVSNIKSVGFSDNAPIEVVNLLYDVVK